VTLTTAAAIYFLVWWTVLFAVLPWGVRSQHESEQPIVPGTDPGAPAIPHLGLKLIWTTVAATTVFVLMFVIYVYRLISLDDLATFFGLAG